MDSATLRQLIDIDGYAERGYPHDAWTRLRKEEPVAWCDVPGYPAFWAVTRYDDIVELSKNPEAYRNAPIMAIFPTVQYEPESFPFRHLINMDPPEHRSYRRIVSGRFTPRALEAVRPRVVAAIERTLEPLSAGDDIDFVTQVASVFPLVVIAEMLGIPDADRDRFFHWSNQIIASTDEEYQDGLDATATAEAAVRELFAYFAALADERRRTPREDLTSVIANAEIDGAPMPEWELVSYLALIVVAGNETTRNATSGGVAALLEHPDQLEQLRGGDPVRLRSAVEEIVRWTTPVVQFTRTPVRDLELRGQKIRAGDPLCLFYASANRDEEIFDDPFAFRVDRRPNRHIGFGVGEHVCMGAHLARMQLIEFLRAFVARFPATALAGPLVRQRSSFVGGVKHLPVRLGA